MKKVEHVEHGSTFLKRWLADFVRILYAFSVFTQAEGTGKAPASSLAAACGTGAGDLRVCVNQALRNGMDGRGEAEE